MNSGFWPERLLNLTFSLPDRLIARHPPEIADQCRLMLLEKKTGQTKTTHFSEIAKYLREGDLIITNNTNVEARRVFLKRRLNSELHECLFLRTDDAEKKIWDVLMYRSRKIKPGETFSDGINLSYEFTLMQSEKGCVVRCDRSLTAWDFTQIGEMPIPPYLNRRADKNDTLRYQNYFAQPNRNDGSVASPTASLHFTAELEKTLRQEGIIFADVNLTVGYGTFAPLRKENFESNTLHAEKYIIPEATAGRLREHSGRIIALGTTSLRVIETVYRLTGGKYNDYLTGETDLFLYPPSKILSATGLITNFHLPQSSLFLLTAAMSEPSNLLQAYNEAMQKEFLFYSYGDAMFITDEVQNKKLRLDQGY